VSIPRGFSRAVRFAASGFIHYSRR
jgi:hypothetical protein